MFTFKRKRSYYIDLSRYTNLNPKQLDDLNFMLQDEQSRNFQMQPNKIYNCAANIERVYYHTSTYMPILPNEIDQDSDEELVPEWLVQQTEDLINDFTDLNEGEKGIMRLWNLFVMKNNVIAFSQMYDTCGKFIEENWEKLVELNLINNFKLHMVCLCDCNLLTPTQMLELWRKFRSYKNKMNI